MVRETFPLKFNTPRGECAGKAGALSRPPRAQLCRVLGPATEGRQPRARLTVLPFPRQCSVKNCRTAFHVTCAFDRGLEMKTILAENDEVKFKSYCPKHSSHRKAEGSLAAGAAQENGGPLEPRAGLEPKQEEAHRGSVRKQKLQQLEDAFYTFVNLLDVARALRLPEEVVDFLYQYWKLKRKVNFNKPLITPKRDEEDNLAKREQDVLFRRLQLFTHLRQDLERVMIDTDTL